MFIYNINFYHHQARLAMMGVDEDGDDDHDYYIKRCGGRAVFFENADDEQLIGCELDFTDR